VTSFGWSPLSEIFREPNWRDLILDQWLELSHFDVEPDIDFEAMYALEEAGHYRTWVARNDGLMIGFIQWMFMRPFAYRGQLWAMDRGHYIDCLFRDTATAIDMWRSAEVALREMGVDRVMGHDNVKRPLDTLFKRLGYEKMGSMFQRRLV
jgi:hypothetical protein